MKRDYVADYNRIKIQGIKRVLLASQAHDAIRTADEFEDALRQAFLLGQEMLRDNKTLTW